MEVTATGLRLLQDEDGDSLFHMLALHDKEAEFLDLMNDIFPFSGIEVVLKCLDLHNRLGQTPIFIVGAARNGNLMNKIVNCLEIFFTQANNTAGGARCTVLEKTSDMWPKTRQCYAPRMQTFEY